MANRASVEWWDGLAGREALGRIVDISDGGARLEADDLPPPGRTVWFRLEQPATEWVRATVVRHDGRHEAGLEFEGACPYDLFQAATLGVSFESLFA